MSLLVVGSVALDNVLTPSGDRPDILGGAASHFSVGASLFTPVRLVGVIGDDFPGEHLEFFGSRDIDLDGLTRIEGGKTFRWTGRYVGKMDVAETLETQLNVLGDHRPPIPESFLDSRFVLLANDAPENQLHVARQMKSAEFIMMDTMNLWIDTRREALIEVLGSVHAVVINDEEARSLAGCSNLIAAMRRITEMGPGTVFVKRGEHGATLHSEGRFFALPAFPVENVVDPTGAGDTFAAGIMGHIGRTGDLSFQNLKSAMAHGIVLASFNVGGFGLEGVRGVTLPEVEQRLGEFRLFTELDG